MPSPDLSVIIPTYRRHVPLAHTLQCLTASTVRPIEILIIDQTPGPLPNHLAFQNPLIRIIRLEKPNLPAARNTGLAQAKGDVLLFLDDDVEFGPELLSEHIKAHDSHPEVTAVAGKILLVEPEFWPDQDFVAGLDPLTAKFSINFSLDKKGPVDYFGGGHVSLKRNGTLRITGLFDENYCRNALWEEVDFAIRLRKAGGRIFYHPNAVLTHKREVSGGCRVGKKLGFFWWKFRNTGYFYGKHLFKGNPFPFLKAMKNEIEFYTRKPGGHAWTNAALYFAAVKWGILKGLAERG